MTKKYLPTTGKSFLFPLRVVSSSFPLGIFVVSSLLVDKRIGSITSTITDIIAFCSKLSLGNFEIHIILQLYESVFLSKLLFNSQSWSRIKKKELEDLQHVQLRMLKQVMKVPYTTPTAGIFLELGLLPIEHLINQRKLTFLHHILNFENSRTCNMFN